MSRLRRLASRVLVAAAALVSSACIEPQTFGTLKGVVIRGARSEFGRRYQAGGSRPPNPWTRRYDY
jgi:hypothetical protein